MPTQPRPGRSIESLFAAVRTACPAPVWSKGVEITRAATTLLCPCEPDEVALTISLPTSPVAPKVVLWPDEDNWSCNCGAPDDPCAHVAAAVILLKNGRPLAPVAAGPEPGSATPPEVGRVAYRLRRSEGELRFRRVVVYPGKEDELSGSLTQLVGGINSGRIKSPPIAATKEDYTIDAALEGGGGAGAGGMVLGAWLLPALSRVTEVSLDDEPIRVVPGKLPVVVEVSEEGDGFRLRRSYDGPVAETFRHGIALLLDGEPRITAVEEPRLNRDEARLLAGRGTVFGVRDTARLVSSVLPLLERRFGVRIMTSKLPKVRAYPARIAFTLRDQPDDTLWALPRLVYGDPPVAEIGEHGIEMLKRVDVPIRDRDAEVRLVRELQTTLNLRPGHPVQFRGEDALRFRERVGQYLLEGSGTRIYETVGELTPRFDFSGGGFDLRFEASGLVGTPRSADPTTVLRAWKEGRTYVPLLDAGWATVPREWLGQYGPRIEALLAARAERNELPAHSAPELAALCEETSQPCPDPVRELRDRLRGGAPIGETPLPEDLTAELRSYQRQGVAWLSLLRDAKIGAMLADDMGLGKTLQALCAMKGRTLIVAPASVLSSWLSQIARFRPALRVSVYHGTERELDAHADVTLTTYGVLRLDKEELSRPVWGTIILDEAQTIKNPESQVARAAYHLRGEFRITLTGTPVENRLEDLWSQFHFLNPGLLGDREAFGRQYAGGGEAAALLLRTKIRPFVLRRLKRDVAPELPERTEVVLHCELDSEERAAYNALLAATKATLLSKELGKVNVFAALEALLRLRQLCCHRALVPGAGGEGADSSKLSLLIETLTESLGSGHRALVFSQWTSYLDLIGSALSRAEIPYLRLDGSTRDRGAVVEAFQDESGPPVIIISLKAGGVGLTLTRADHVFITDPWWNPAAEDQAADRAHRIGQKNPVLIHRLVARETIEDRILELQSQKAELARSVMADPEGRDGAPVITREDILALLG